MNILELPAYYEPERVASNYLSKNREQAFVEAGFDIIIFTPTPCRGISQKLRREYVKRNHRLEHKFDGQISIHRFAMYAEGNNPVLRAGRYFLCWLAQLWKGLTVKDVDCAYLASTPPIQGLLGSIIKKIRKVPFVYNLQDIFPDSLYNNGLAKKEGLLWKIGRMIENFTYKHADKIIVISEDFKKNIMGKGVPEEKIVVVYNWVEQDNVTDVPREENKLFDIYGLDRSKFYVTYNGNIGLSQNMDMLMDVARDLESNEDIQFVLVGNGAYKKKLEQTIKDKNIKNVTVLPFQPYEDIKFVFSLGDTSLVISKPGTGSASVPSKTWSIMSASRPVLANFDENELKDIVEKHRCGIFTKAGDKEAFKQSIFTLYENRDLCQEYGKNGRQFILDNLTREVGTQKYVDVIKSVVNK